MILVILIHDLVNGCTVVRGVQLAASSLKKGREIWKSDHEKATTGELNDNYTHFVFA